MLNQCFEICKFICKPEIPDNPNMIIIGEAPGREEMSQGRPFVGATGKLLRSICQGYGIRAIFLNSQNCWTEDKPTPERLVCCRDTFILPILDLYPTLPIVGLGEYSIHSLLRYKGKISSHLTKGFMIKNHVALFTYHPAYYLRSRNPEVLDHIKMTLSCALKPIIPRTYTTIQNFEDLPFSEKIYLDIETTGTDLPWYGTEILIVGMRANNKNYVLFPECFQDDRVKRYFEDSNKIIIGHEIIFDLLFLKNKFGININGSVYDTLIREKNESYQHFSYGLKYFAKLMDFPAYEAESNTILKSGNSLITMPTEDLISYCCYDLEVTEALEKTQREYAENLNFNIEMSYLKTILNMIDNGLYVNLSILRDISEECSKRLIELSQEIYNGQELNLRSPKQVQELLKRLGVKVPNTRKETLEALEEKPKEIEKLIEYRSITQRSNICNKGYTQHLDKNSYIHSSFRVHGAETTRLTSSSPNLQNVDPRLRRMFISRFQGGSLISTDLSSLEYRLIAHDSNDSTLIRLFKGGLDIHENLGKIIFDRTSITKDERTQAKTCNYILVYGGGENKLMEELNISSIEASQLYGRIKNLYPGIARWRSSLEQFLITNRFYVNMFGMRRYFSPPISFNLINEGFNWRIQSAGHQILMVYLMRLEKVLNPQVLLVNELHDEGLFDCPSSLVEESKSIIERIGGDLWDIIKVDLEVALRIPIVADVEVMTNWK